MKRRTYVLWKRGLTRLFILGLVVGALYVYFRTGFFTIHTYTIVGAPEVYLAELQNGVRLVADQRLYKVLPGNRSISYHDDEIRMLILETLPNTSDISIYPRGLHTLAIKIQSHEPIFSVSDTHAIARDGTIYKEIIPLVDFPRLSISTTTAVVPLTLVSLSMLIKNINTVLFPVKYITIDEYNDIRLYDATKRMSIMLSSTSDFSKVWSNMVSAIDTDPLKKKLLVEKERLEYIDARFGNKVFYKFTNGGNTAIIPSTHVPSTSSTTPQ